MFLPLMKVSGNVLALTLIWVTDFVFLGILLIDLVTGVAGYYLNIQSLENSLDPYRFVRDGGDVRKLGEDDAVLFCRSDGWICAPRAPGWTSRFANGKTFEVAGLGVDGKLYIVADKGCPLEKLFDVMNEPSQCTTNIYLVGCDGNGMSCCVNRGRLGTFDAMICHGVAIDLSPIRSALYGDFYYMFSLYKLAVDFLKGDFRMKQVVL